MSEWEFHDVNLFLRQPLMFKIVERLTQHLILSSPNQVYQYDIKVHIFAGKGTHWLYPYSKTIELENSESFACLGVKFKVGALYSLNSALFNQAVVNTVRAIDFDVYKDTDLVSPDELIVKAKDEPDKGVEMLDQLFKHLLINCHEDNHSEITRQAIPLLASEPINSLGDLLLCSQRTLERSFLKVTGLTLKQCDIDWVDIAYQFGFSDQPHLIRYLKQQINLTSKSYAQQRGFTIDVYGGVKSK
jgi:AraC-like DNA-binding protein